MMYFSCVTARWGWSRVWWHIFSGWLCKNGHVFLGCFHLLVHQSSLLSPLCFAKLPFLFENHSAVSEALPLAGLAPPTLLWCCGVDILTPRQYMVGLRFHIQAGRSWKGSSQHVAAICRGLMDGWVVYNPSFLEWWTTPDPHTTRISHSFICKVDPGRWFPASDCACLMGCQLTNISLLRVLSGSLLLCPPFSFYCSSFI